MEHTLVKLTSTKDQMVYINPLHIRAIYVLQDGAYSIIYGSGENDFVQITTKEFHEQLAVNLSFAKAICSSPLTAGATSPK